MSYTGQWMRNPSPYIHTHLRYVEEETIPQTLIIADQFFVLKGLTLWYAMRVKRKNHVQGPRMPLRTIAA